MMILIEIESIIFGIICVIIYKILISKTSKKEKKLSDIFQDKNPNNFNININKTNITVNLNKIECKCKTFFIDESELQGCEYCIAEYIKYNKHRFSTKNYEKI